MCIASVIPANTASTTMASATSGGVAGGADNAAPGPTSDMPEAYCVAHWYAVYTSANHEKRVAEHLDLRKVEHFLPLYDSVRRWKDRRVTLQLPLFPGYVFVRMALRDRLQTLSVPGVVRLVGFNGAPSALRQEDIEIIQNCLSQGYRIEPHPYLTIGSRVRIVRGPLQGVEGILVRKKNPYRVVLTLDLIRRSAAVEVSAQDVECSFEKGQVASWR